MKSCLYGRTAYVLLFMLLYCLVRSFSLIEARDLRAELVGRGGIGLAISTCESMSCNNKVGGLKLQPTADIHGRKVYGSPPVKVIGRSAKENMIDVVYPVHSPGIGHPVPPD